MGCAAPSQPRVTNCTGAKTNWAGVGCRRCLMRGEDFLLALGTLPLGPDLSQPHIFGKRLLAAAFVSHIRAAPPLPAALRWDEGRAAGEGAGGEAMC